MTADQEEILRIDEKIRLYRERRKELVERIKDCTHPCTYSYDWQIDNGYGVQHKHFGQMCRFCKAIQHWPTGNWTLNGKYV